MRVWAERVYGIPPEQVVGTVLKTRYTLVDDKPTLTVLPELALMDDKSGKPVGIHQYIGRRPAMCFGNSDGDYEMLQWTTIGRKPTFGLIVHHTDAEREYAYDARPKSTGKLVEALTAAPETGLDRRRYEARLEDGLHAGPIGPLARPAVTRDDRSRFSRRQPVASLPRIGQDWLAPVPASSCRREAISVFWRTSQRSFPSPAGSRPISEFRRPHSRHSTHVVWRFTNESP